MVNIARHLLILAVLLSAAGASARGQAPDLLPPPTMLPPLPRPTPAPEAVVPSASWLPPEYTLPPEMDPLGCAFRVRDPLLEDPRWSPLGWFADAEAALVGTHIRNRLVDILAVSPTRFDTVRVPGAGLDWTVMPRFDVGYRLPHGLGEFLVSYQFINTQGANDILNPTGVSHQTSRLTWNSFDFDYAIRQRELIPDLDMRWRAGVKSTSMFFDFRGDQPGEALAGGAVEQRASNYIIGAGPHVVGEFSRPVNVPGLALFARSELAWLWVHLHQHFEETLPGIAGVVADDARNTQGVGFLAIQAGLHWTPPNSPLTQFFLGYQFEGWSQVGRNDNNGSYADVFQHGIFFRGQIDF